MHCVIDLIGVKTFCVSASNALYRKESDDEGEQDEFDDSDGTRHHN